MSPLEQALAALHQPLLRFAKLQLRDEAAAEDAVSATLLAILEKPDAFKGGSSPGERARLRLHMVICEACRNVEQPFDLLRRLVRKSEPTDDRGDDKTG